MRGDVQRLRAPRGGRGHEQADGRYAVVVLSEELPLPTWLVAPTSTSARALRLPEIDLDGRTTRVLAEQTAAVDPGRLGELAGHRPSAELRRVDAALRIVLSL